MRLDDVSCAPQVPNHHKTEKMYMPGNTPAEMMSNAQLRLGLCFKSRGDWQECEKCRGGCRLGRILADRMRGRAQEPEEAVERHTVIHLPAAGEKQPEGRESKSTMLNTKANNPRVAAAMERRYQEALQRYVRTMRRVAQGESRDAAAMAEGYTQGWKSVGNFARNHRGDVNAALKAAGLTDMHKWKK